MLNCGDVKVLGDAQAENPNWVHHFMLLILLLCYIFSYTLHLDLKISYLEM